MSNPTPKLLWTPSPDRAHRSQMYQFMCRVAKREGVAPDWEALRLWSVRRPD